MNEWKKMKENERWAEGKLSLKRENEEKKENKKATRRSWNRIKQNVRKEEWERIRE